MISLTIKLNEEEQRCLNELEVLLGIKGTYGADPKAIKIAIKSTINYIKNYRESIEKVIPNLSASEIKLLLPSIINLEKREETLEK